MTFFYICDFSHGFNDKTDEYDPYKKAANPSKPASSGLAAQLRVRNAGSNPFLKGKYRKNATYLATFLEIYATCSEKSDISNREMGEIVFFQ